ncbi:hypothetical protein Ari01nite_14760 [Paractinoplanes rishiriensis]|uniref:Uncharacterized protein n=1 Tax=Paractinoplanes rishiriensis TaxID=1050105 RepID=A0A919MNG7_9ACTN|nr:hypothetical protein Ari01nite_14760 [Actinoplanes rishiriensis]
MTIGYSITIRYRKTGKRSARGPGTYYIDGSVGHRALAITAEPDKGVVSQLTRAEKLPPLPLTSHEFVKAFTSDKK